MDLEEGFHSSTFAKRYPPETWDGLPSLVEDQVTPLLELLARHGHKVTFFVLAWVAERKPLLVRKIAESGHEIASHGSLHQLVYDIGPDAFRADLRHSKATIEQIVGRPVVGYRAASFSITARSLWAFDILAEEGFVWDSSVYPVRHHRYGMPASPLEPHRRGNILELPLATLPIGPFRLGVGGGAYLRFLPKAAWLTALDSVAAGRPLTLYVHPWECDPQQQRLKGSPLALIRQYGGQGTTLGKLEAAFARHEFGTFGALAAATGA